MRNSFAWRVFGSIPFLLLLASSCEAFYDLSTDQCDSNADCVARFGLGYSCDVGLCTADSNDAGTSGKSGGKGGSRGTTSGSGGDAGDGEGANGGTGGVAGTAGSGGTGGTDPVVECETHKD